MFALKLTTSCQTLSWRLVYLFSLQIRESSFLSVPPHLFYRKQQMGPLISSPNPLCSSIWCANDPCCSCSRLLTYIGDFRTVAPYCGRLEYYIHLMLNAQECINTSPLTISWFWTRRIVKTDVDVYYLALRFFNLIDALAIVISTYNYIYYRNLFIPSFIILTSFCIEGHGSACLGPWICVTILFFWSISMR